MDPGGAVGPGAAAAACDPEAGTRELALIPPGVCCSPVDPATAELLGLLRARIERQEATIEALRRELRRSRAAAAAPAEAAASLLAPADRHPLPLDAVLANWCESGTASYIEFLRVAETCTSWRRRVLHQLRLLRTLELRCELHLPPAGAAAGERRCEWKSLYKQGYAKYLAAVTKALDRMGGNLQALHLRRQACFLCSVSQESSSREVVLRLNALAQKHATLRLTSLTWSLGLGSLAGLSTRILQTLRELDIASNALGDEGCKVLRDTLLGQRCAVGGAEGAWGGSLADDCAAAGPLTNLTRLDVSDNGIRDAGFYFLITALCRLPSLTCLNVSGNSPGRAGCAALGSLIASSPRLRTLGLQQCSNIYRNITSHDFSALELAVAHGPASGAAGYFAAIQSVVESGSGAGSVGSSVGHLLELRLGGNGCRPGFERPRSAALARLLQRLPKLQLLDLNCCQLAAADADRLAEGLSTISSSLSTLDLSWNTLNASALAALSGNLASTTLEVLDLSDNALGDAGCEVLAKAWQSVGGAALQLRTLSLDGTLLGDASCMHLVRALGESRALQKLSVARNRISAPGANAFASALSRGQFVALESLVLRQNDIGRYAARLLATAIKGFSHEALDWQVDEDMVEMDDEDLESIAELEPDEVDLLKARAVPLLTVDSCNDDRLADNGDAEAAVMRGGSGGSADGAGRMVGYGPAWSVSTTHTQTLRKHNEFDCIPPQPEAAAEEAGGQAVEGAPAPAPAPAVAM
jgi:Ran GTPase-activating protein (RanGAP) involved in mRNA processing and transport